MSLHITWELNLAIVAESSADCWFVAVCLQVLLGRWQAAPVAVKLLKEECTEHVGAHELASLRREAKMLQALSHPHILRFYGACFTCRPVRTRKSDSRSRHAVHASYTHSCAVVCAELYWLPACR